MSSKNAFDRIKEMFKISVDFKIESYKLFVPKRQDHMTPELQLHKTLGPMVLIIDSTVCPGSK